MLFRALKLPPLEYFIVYGHILPTICIGKDILINIARYPGSDYYLCFFMIGQAWKGFIDHKKMSFLITENHFLNIVSF